MQLVGAEIWWISFGTPDRILVSCPSMNRPQVTLLLHLLFSVYVGATSSSPFHPTPDRDYDLQHMVLDVKIDLHKKTLTGTVTHVLSPLADQLRQLAFDSESTTVHRVVLNGDKDLDFQLVDKKLWIDLDQSYGWEDTLRITISFTSRPQLGFYFVQPDSVYPLKQLQGWSQGEDTDNHYWVPLYDYPNDKTTWECRVTVDTPLVAISNGELVSTTTRGSQRTFHWREQTPNVTYLLAIAVGRYKKVTDQLGDLPVNYWVYQRHTPEDARRSFGKTPAMIRFFSELTGVEFPFEKYDQVLIEDFMWGGMENVTCTFQTDRTMHSEAARPHQSSDGLVAHELAHQWFGDYLTTRNWANIWLNEGFATYLAMVWQEHDAGVEAAEYTRYWQLRSVGWADGSHRRPTVQYYYDNSMELFDANVYAKGSIILNMLRRYLGEEAFWRAIRYYTQTNGGSNVETTDLKKAFEVVTGKNLYWFFDQWVYQPGLPKLEVKTRYDRRNRRVNITLKQSSSGKEEVIYKLPMTVLIDDGNLHRETIFFEDPEATFTLPAQHPPKMVIVDEGWQIPKYMTFSKRPGELIYQLGNAPQVLDRIWAARELSKQHATKAIAEALIASVKNDPFWGVRVEAANAFRALKPRQGHRQLLTVLQDQDPRVLTACIKALGAYREPVVRDTLLDLLHRDKHEYVISAALEALTRVDYDSALQLVDWALKQDSHEEVIRRAAMNILGERQTEENYQRLLSLATYGGTTYNARPSAVGALSSFVEKYPTLVETATDWLEDPNWQVRRNAFLIVGKYGHKEHLSAALRVIQNEARGIRMAKMIKGLLQDRIKGEGKRKISRKETRELQEILDQLEEIIRSG